MDTDTVTKTVELAGERFPVIDVGSGPAVLLHGFPDSSYLWRYRVRALVAAGFRVVAPDLRGNGEAQCFPSACQRKPTGTRRG